jgi:hypothetical protein
VKPNGRKNIATSSGYGCREIYDFSVVTPAPTETVKKEAWS